MCVSLYIRLSRNLERSKTQTVAGDNLRYVMKITRIFQATTWSRALRAARATVGKSDTQKEPSDTWKARMLLAEHSPIRLVEFDVRIEDIRQWVTVHLVRHWLGFIPFVHSQRSDRRTLDCSRDELPQGSLNDMEFSVNAQALINISRKRLCSQASPETRETWKSVKAEIGKLDPVMASKMVPECIFRGFCPELQCCGYAGTEKYKKELEEYRKEAMTNGQHE